MCKQSACKVLTSVTVPRCLRWLSSTGAVSEDLVMLPTKEYGARRKVVLLLYSSHKFLFCIKTI